MSRLVVDALLPEKLRVATEPVELVDASGRVLGTYFPELETTKWENLEPQLSPEELERRRREPGGRKLSDILADLEKGS
jgi:hypothetical protein